MPVLTKINTNVIADDAVTSAKIPADAVIASDIAAGAVGISELSSVTGITADYHKVPTFANDAARNTAIPSPANGMIIFNTASGALQQYNGAWAAISPAPIISSTSGFLNEDTDSTLSIFGSNFNSSSIVKMFSASAGGSQVGSNATTTFNSNSKLTAVFGAGSLGDAGDTVYIEVDNSGVTNRFATAITLNADPTVTHAGATGTSANTTTHLGTYSGAVSVVDSDTTMLLNFDKGGGTDFEDSSNIGGDGFNLIAGADAIIKSSPFGDGKSAMFFDGSNDFLTVTQSAIPYGTSVRSFDFWMKNTSTTNNYQYIIEMGAGSTGQSWRLSLRQSGGYLRFNGWGDDHDTSVHYTTFLNVWRHIAMVFDASENLRIYVDGTRVLDLDDTANSVNTGSSNLTIGSLSAAMSPASTSWYTGYIDEFHITNTDRSTNGGVTFPVPTERYTQTSATKLLIHSNLGVGSLPGSTFTDSSATGHTVTASGSIHSTLYNGTENSVFLPAMTFPASGKKFGSYGTFFDGTGDYLYIEGAEKLIFAGTWAIDFWVNVTSIGNYDGIISFDQTGAADVAIGFGTGDSKIHLFSDAGSTTSVVNSVDTISLNTWYHIAVTRDGTTTRFFLNGVVKDTDTSWNGTWTPLSSGDAIIGRWSPTAGGNNFHGYLDLLRISIGTARWTTTFTPPTTLYNGVAGSATVPTITFTGTATPALAADEDIEFTAVENSAKADGSRSLIDTDVGLVLTNLTGGDKSKATLTGTLTSAASTTHTNMPLKLQVRKTLGNAAYANASRTVTFSSSTVTTGLAPAMPVTGTGIPASTTITTVDSATTITLSANPTGGTLTGQSLVFLDPTRISHQYNGSDTLDNTDAMYTLATGAGGGATLFEGRRYVGTSTLRHITGFGFAPDLLWIKARNIGYDNNIFDTFRGASSIMRTNADTAAQTVLTSLVHFDADGAGLGAGVDNNQANKTYVAYGWKAGGTPTAVNAGGQTPTSGSKMIDGAISVANYTTANIYPKRQSVNTAGLFSISEYIGSGSQATIPHGLGVAPDLAMVKCTSHTGKWVVHHNGHTEGYVGYLDTNAAQDGTGDHIKTSGADSIHLNNGHDRINGSSKTYIMYCWAAVDGVSAFGSYSGSGSTPQSITYAGGNEFTARWFLIKRLNGTQSWIMLDGFRSTGRWTKYLYADATNAEGDENTFGITPTSTGFSFTSVDSGTPTNTSGGTYIYCAFA